MKAKIFSLSQFSPAEGWSQYSDFAYSENVIYTSGSLDLRSTILTVRRTVY